MSKRLFALLACLPILALMLAGPASAEEDARSRLQRLAREASKNSVKANEEAENLPEIDLPEGVLRLLETPGQDTQPTWSPDGALYFVTKGGGPDRILRFEIGESEPDTIVAHPHYPAAEPAISPDGKFLAYQSQRPDTKRSIWIRRLEDGLEGKLREDLDYKEKGVIWSHAGGRLYFARQDYETRIVSAASCLKNGEGLKILGNEDGEYYHPTLSPDGSELAWIHRKDRESKIIIMSTKLNTLTRDLTTPGYVITAMDYLPDGRRMIVSFMDMSDPAHGFDLGVLDLETGEVRAQIDVGPYDSDPEISPDGRMVAFSANPNRIQDIYVWTLPSDLGGEE